MNKTYRQYDNTDTLEKEDTIFSEMDGPFEEFKRITEDIHRHMFSSEFDHINRKNDIRSGRRIMYYSVFTEYFLPRILGEIEDPEWIGRWQSVAVTMAGYVDVIHDSTYEVLFRVPGLLQTGQLGIADKDEYISPSEIVSGYKIRQGNKLSRPDRYLENGLSRIHDAISEGVDMTEAREQWIKILKFCGRGDLVEEETKVDEEDKVGVEDETPEVMYDDDLDDGLDFEY